MALAEQGEHDSHGAATAQAGQHFSCSLSAVLLARVHDYGGDPAVAEVLDRAGARRPLAELTDIANWISYDEAVALWRAGAAVTHHPHFARAVGEDAAQRLNSSPVAALLRSLGSPEAVYGQITTTSAKYSTVARLEAVDSGPGFAHIRAVAVEGFERSPEHCEWTCGLLSQPAMLFGLPPATVEHERCAAFGAPACEYRVTWSADQARASSESSAQIETLGRQLEAMRERLHSMFETASDLIGAGQLEDVLARIADRAATEVRAPRYLLAIRMPDGDELHLHHRGLEPGEAEFHAERLLERHPVETPESWLAVSVRSSRHDYGRLVAMYDTGSTFFPQERELLEVYARYAASALDSATNLLEAERRYRQSSALLGLARALATAGTSREVAARLAEAIPEVVDCDRIGTYLWDPGRGELVRGTLREVGGGEPVLISDRSSWTPSALSILERLLADPQPDPLFLDEENGDPQLREMFTRAGFSATILVPLAAPGRFLGLLTVSVYDGPQRLRPTSDLLDRLSGVAAQATTALQNGELLDQITYQALHDQLTGLANRAQFTSGLTAAIHEARERQEKVSLLYVDLDRFKPVNDEYGHDIGDDLLAAAGERLKQCARASDVVARLGGDEFAVILTGHRGQQRTSLPARIEAAFARPFLIGGHEIRLGASVGRSVFPTDADDADALLRHADAAMFRAKRARRQAGPGAGLPPLAA
ncbi:MAG TPA: sensor domain-containing diguanylate cyclase [Solirubrobacteraceae bacterium]